MVVSNKIEIAEGFSVHHVVCPDFCSMLVTRNDKTGKAMQSYSYSDTIGKVHYWTMNTRFWNKMETTRTEQSICIYAAMWVWLAYLWQLLNE